MLIVDDSTVMRSQIRMALEGVDGIEVVGFASNGQLACEFLKSRSADIVILDLEMPVLDGLGTLEQMKRQGFAGRVIVFSAQTEGGAASTLAALNAGAADFIAKPSMEQPGGSPHEVIRRYLLPKLLQFCAAGERVPEIRPAARLRSGRRNSPRWICVFVRRSYVVIASSTGGPNALEKLFSFIQGPLSAPILIAQHMPPLFTASLAERLARVSGLPVREAVAGETVRPGHVYIAPGDFHMRVVRGLNETSLALDQGAPRNSVRPAADYLFESAAAAFGRDVLGLVLTGMGADGRDGAVALKNAGCPVLAQDRESCVVFGMPAAVIEAGAPILSAISRPWPRRWRTWAFCRLTETAGKRGVPA
ncbi:MAG: chemotaxis-specific protein-glutamate methyltransferase CheB [Calothrix sp. SM1_5_4]|nr:chemotaxis-specific protein-glutamate methyltransferase CheB [Calothrix sp. SM1_5_4]